LNVYSFTFLLILLRSHRYIRN